MANCRVIPSHPRSSPRAHPKPGLVSLSSNVALSMRRLESPLKSGSHFGGRAPRYPSPCREPGSPSAEAGLPRTTTPSPGTRHAAPAPGSQVLPRAVRLRKPPASSTPCSSLNPLPIVANLTLCYSLFFLFSSTNSTSIY